MILNLNSTIGKINTWESIMIDLKNKIIIFDNIKTGSTSIRSILKEIQIVFLENIQN